MAEDISAAICVIGAGAAGLSVAAGAALLGRNTVLIEAGEMGGECLNTGCVPSKALLAAAQAAATARAWAPRGIGHDAVKAGPAIDFARVHAHLQGVIAAIHPNDSQARFEGLGCTVVRERARFIGPDRVQAGEKTIRARRFVIATGGKPALPPVPGLAELPFETNETIFTHSTLPRHLVILGGGPIGCEMAQAFARLGAEVTLIERARLLPTFAEELAAPLRRALGRAGVRVLEGAEAIRASGTAGALSLNVRTASGASEDISGDRLLVAAGRKPGLADLDLYAAGVDHDDQGIHVGPNLRTSNRRIWALGDCIRGAPKLTHAAGYQASLVIRSMLFRLPARADYATIPQVVYTDPEIAQIGMGEEEAQAHMAAKGRPEALKRVRWALADNDRAAAEHSTDGHITLWVDTKKGRLLGAGIAAPHAGEMIPLYTLMLHRKLGLTALTGMTMAYPTLAEIGKRAAGAHYGETLFSPKVRRLLDWLEKLP